MDVRPSLNILEYKQINDFCQVSSFVNCDLTHIFISLLITVMWFIFLCLIYIENLRWPFWVKHLCGAVNKTCKTVAEARRTLQSVVARDVLIWATLNAKHVKWTCSLRRFWEFTEQTEYLVFVTAFIFRLNWKIFSF